MTNKKETATFIPLGKFDFKEVIDDLYQLGYVNALKGIIYAIERGNIKQITLTPEDLEKMINEVEKAFKE